MKVLSRFLASMTGRMFVILVVGVTLSGSIGLAIADGKRRADLERLHLERAVDHVQDYVSLFVAAPDGRPPGPENGGPGDVGAASNEARGLAPDPVMLQLLNARLQGASAERVERADIVTCLPFLAERRGRGAPRDQRDSEFRPPKCWLIDLKLGDGRPIRVALDTPPRLVNESRAFDPVYLSVIGLAALLLSLLVARMAAAPLSRMAEAAQTLGRDLNSKPLDEQGPTEVREAAHAFNTMQRRLRRHLAERTQILAAITHDLQTPLTRLRLRLEKVKDEKLRNALVADLAAMQSLIRQGLDLARSTDSSEAVVTLDLDSLLESLVDDEASAGRDASFLGGCGCDVRVPAQALRRALSNLIDNAIVYGGCAQVSAKVSGGDVVVEIRDRGPGLPADKLEAVFEPFFRLEDSRSRETGGSGLGLTIARALVEKCGGALVLANGADGGAEARVTLPRAGAGRPRGSDGLH